jgi:hypothetical protein
MGPRCQDLRAGSCDIRAWARNRERAFEKKADIYITNHDAATWLAKQSPKFFERFGHLVIDESTAVKTPNSNRSKATYKIRGYFQTCRMMSGTPTPNGITDIWHQALVMDKGQRLGKSFFAFRNATCVSQQVGPMPNMVRWTAKEGAADAVSARLADVAVRHQLDECVDMPEKIIRTFTFPLSPKHRAIYERMEKESVAEIGEHMVTAINGAVLWGKLLQIASGSVYADDFTALVDDLRYEMVMDLVCERPHSIVVFQWTHQRDALLKLCEARGLSFAVIDGDTSDTERGKIVERYQAGEYRVLLGHPKSMAHGLTFTRGEAVIWPSPTINLEWWEQANRRIYRIGQTKRTETIVLIAENTRDVEAHERCMGKELDAAEFLRMLKEFHK